jgi:hypothetical protein
MKPTSARMAPRLRGALLALSMAAMATQVGGASAAVESGPRGVVPLGAASVARSGERTALAGRASQLPGTPVSDGWGLLVASLLGAGAIGHRRMSALGSRSLDPHGLRRR